MAQPSGSSARHRGCDRNRPDSAGVTSADGRTGSDNFFNFSFNGSESIVFAGGNPVNGNMHID